MNNPNKEVDEFLHKYEAKAYLSNKMFRRMRRIKFDYKDIDSAFDTITTLPVDEEPYVEVLIPQDRFRHLVEMEQFVKSVDTEREWAKRQYQDMKKESWIRQKNESVRKAYERYQTLLNLVRHDYD
jgi:hypothetical protein